MKIGTLVFDARRLPRHRWVLNSERWFERGEADRLGADFDPELDATWIMMLDPEAVARFERLVTASGAKVVVSSSWRMMVSLPDLARFLAMRGFTGEIIDATTTSQGLDPHGVTQRGHQIAHWLAANPVTSYVILDDQTDMAHLGDRHVLTTSTHASPPCTSSITTIPRPTFGFTSAGPERTPRGERMHAPRSTSSLGSCSRAPRRSLVQRCTGLVVPAFDARKQ